MTVQNPALHSGILRAFDSGAYLATVQLTGSLMLYLTSVPVSRDLAAADLATGRKVAVALFDPNNHQDAVLFAVWT